MTFILGIETSCDETAASIVHGGCRVRSNVIASQHDLHRRYQGIVPEIASRAHLERMIPVIDQALAEAGIGFDQIDAVAVGHRPGLIGSLLVGVSAAKALAWSIGKPLIGVDHVRAHLYAATLVDHGEAPWATAGAPDVLGTADCVVGKGPVALNGPPRYPAVGLVVSGGHTSLYEIECPTRMRLLGRTIDDAVGEAYDKAAVVLNLGYPGGPNLDKVAAQGNPLACHLPRSLLGSESLDFSFSGLKTALLYMVRGRPRGSQRGVIFERSACDLSDQERADIAAAFQAAAVDTLMIKLGRAVDQLTRRGRPPRGLVIGGGASANSLLRRQVAQLGPLRGINVSIPALPYCLDNAAMIAGLAYHHMQNRWFDDMALEPVVTTVV